MSVPQSGRVSTFLPIVLVLATLAVFLQWMLFQWVSTVWEQASRVMAGPWA